MTSIFYKPILTAIAFSFLLQGCWTFESNIKVKDVLFDDFKIIEDKNDEKAGSVLVLNYDEVFFQTIAERCREIYFDSTGIYIKSQKIDTDTVTSYSHIKVLSLAAGDKDAVFEKEELSFESYNKKIKNCKKCIKRSYRSVTTD
jgi:hypothetical protein